MSNLPERLRERGWRLTAQRRVVAEVLTGDHVHLTADEVHTRASRQLPEIGRATVYNILNDLVALGEIREVSTDDRAKRYDPNAHRPHHHLICTGCGTIRDVHPTADPTTTLPAPARLGFTITTTEITYRGLCPTCTHP
ncbi:transcriptional repressor [Embleya scabrispora]|uniref:Transcriptional repressor n=1 Tax=Embleya scabrispora TaxID=159449 RepID=A0A1T3NWJ5_9ACTN|nr:transcriptional repressor [Embleya scabrispora]OPC81213.1 transcriptional repressor [Embleya scabrispora]